MANSCAARVSVIVPVYNASKTIGATLASVFAQTCHDFEVVVVDDGSEDGAALDQALAPWRDRLRVFSQANAGAGAARNRAIAEARGELLAFLDADDLWEPGFLARQVGLFDAHPELDMSWTDGRILGDTPLAGRTFFASTQASCAPSFIALVRQTCTVLTSSVVVRRALVQAVSGFDARLRRGQDYDLWLRLAHAGARMAVVTEPLVSRRVHAANLSGDTATELRRAITVLERLPASVPLLTFERAEVEQRVAVLRSQLELELAKCALREGAVSDAWVHLGRAVHTANWKTRAAAVGLQVAPRLLRRIYLWSSSASQDASPA